jgi:catechol 2,3-dioxygenase-like lactoylglutathione lyase family enzyme
MINGIDHLVIACADPDAAAAGLERSLGLRAAGGGRHDALGTFNRLIWLGDSYLELIGVFDERLAATGWIGRPALRALERGGGLATYALASDDLEADVERLRAAGALIEGPLRGERTRADGRVVRWLLAAPPVLGPHEPGFLIEHDTTAAEWTPPERAACAAEVHPAGGPVRLEALEIPVPDVRAATMSQLRTLGLQFRPSLGGRGARDASIGSQTLRLLPQARAGSVPTIHLRILSAASLGGEDVAAAGREPVEALGCRWLVRA